MNHQVAGQRDRRRSWRADPSSHYLTWWQHREIAVVVADPWL